MTAGSWQEYEGDADVPGWDRLAGDGPLPLQQCWAYGEAMRQFGARPLRLVCHGGDGIVASAQLIQNRLFGILKPAACFRGPLWTEPESNKSELLGELRRMFPKRRLEFLLAMPEEESTPEAHQVMRAAGFRRVMTGYSTIWMDLTADEDVLRQQLDGKWRNALVKAEAAGIEVSVGGKKPHQYQWLLDREGEQRAAVQYIGLPTGLVGHFAEAAEGSVGRVVSLTAIREREKIAGALFLLHGNSATYFIGWNGDEGRATAAHNLLMWRAMRELKERGIRWLDLGGINTTHGAGIARFKLGMGTQPVTLAGTYL